MFSYYQKIILCVFCLYLFFTNGVFGVDSDVVTSVSVIEGDSVTLHTHLTDLQTHDQILWIFEPQEIRLAEIHRKQVYMYDSNTAFGDRLKLDSQTGSLTIINIRITDSGHYKLQIFSDRGILYKRFNVTVYTRLAVPVIIRNSSQCSSSSERSSVSKCVLLCSVMNVTHVSLSWYKRNSLLSSISVSDLNIRLSLPLEVEYQDTNTYRCVVNNPITNHTQHLHINELCGSCSDFLPSHVIVLIAAALICLMVISVILLWRFKKCDKSQREVQTLEEEILYTEPNVFTQKFPTNVGELEHTVYSSVVSLDMT